MTFEQFALIWPIVGICFVVVATMLLTRLQDRWHDSRPSQRHAAE